MTRADEMAVSPLVDRLIDLAIEEDIGHGDITTGALGLGGRKGRAWIAAREPLVLAGLFLVPRVYERLGTEIEFHPRAREGQHILSSGTVVAELSGRMDFLLAGERIALNFLQRLSGIATHVRSQIKELENVPVRITDTRKTLPGWRVLEKYAVRVGGACNHRMGLYDGVLIKDNHIAACGGITAAVAAVRQRISHLIRIEVETETLAQVKEAVDAGADVIMLDNMDDADIARAVDLIDARAEIEVSGRIQGGRINRLAELGVGIVSMGSLTYGAGFVDIHMEMALSDPGL